MRFVLSFVLLFSGGFSPVALADTFRLDWSLSALSFNDAPGVVYNLAKLDIDTGDSNSRYYSVGGALLASDSPEAAVFPVTGTCLGLPDDTIRCALLFERGSLVIDVDSALSGSFAVVNQAGSTTQSGMVFYTGITQ